MPATGRASCPVSPGSRAGAAVVASIAASLGEAAGSGGGALQVDGPGPGLERLGAGTAARFADPVGSLAEVAEPALGARVPGTGVRGDRVLADGGGVAPSAVLLQARDGVEHGAIEPWQNLRDRELF